MCSSLVATSANMKKKLEIVRSTLPDPIEIYAGSIDEKINTITATKESLAKALVDLFDLMEKVHD